MLQPINMLLSFPFSPHKFYGILEDSISYRRKLSSWVCFQWSLLGKCVIVLSCFISVIYSFLLNRLPSVYCVGSDSLTCVWSQLYVTNPHTFALILLPGPPRQIYCYSLPHYSTSDSSLKLLLFFISPGSSLDFVAWCWMEEVLPLSLCPPFPTPLCPLSAVSHSPLASSSSFLPPGCLHVKWRMLTDPQGNIFSISSRLWYVLALLTAANTHTCRECQTYCSFLSNTHAHVHKTICVYVQQYIK